MPYRDCTRCLRRYTRNFRKYGDVRVYRVDPTGFLTGPLKSSNLKTFRRIMQNEFLLFYYLLRFFFLPRIHLRAKRRPGGQSDAQA